MLRKTKYKSKQVQKIMKQRLRRKHFREMICAACFLVIVGLVYFTSPLISEVTGKSHKPAVAIQKNNSKKSSSKEKSSKKKTMNWYDYNAIAHAMGAVDGNIYTNSKEAFEASLKNGFHIFEVDLLQTTDHVLVGKHKWGKVLSDPLSKGSKYRVSYKEFMSTKIYGKYTPISFSDILDFLEENPDIYIMTDTKDENYAEAVSDAKLIVKTAKEAGKEKLLNRLIIQIYSENMLNAVKNIYPFEHILLTTYKQDDVAFSKMIQFCKSNGIEAVTVPTSDVNDYRMKLLSDAGIKSYTHTINSVYETKEYMKLGVYGVYTDLVTSQEVAQAYLDVQIGKISN